MKAILAIAIMMACAVRAQEPPKPAVETDQQKISRLEAENAQIKTSLQQQMKLAQAYRLALAQCSVDAVAATALAAPATAAPAPATVQAK